MKARWSTSLLIGAGMLCLWSSADGSIHGDRVDRNEAEQIRGGRPVCFLSELEPGCSGSTCKFGCLLTDMCTVKSYYRPVVQRPGNTVRIIYADCVSACGQQCGSWTPELLTTNSCYNRYGSYY